MNRALEEATDTLNGLLTEAETALVVLGLGVSAETPLAEGWLGFGKVDQKWRLYFTAQEGGARTPLQSASRGARVLAAGQLWALRDELLKARAKTIGEVETAIEQVQTFLKAS